MSRLTIAASDGDPATHGDVVSDSRLIPLFVDLDGTLTRTNLLLETGWKLIRGNPFYFLSMLWWLLQGRSVLKARIADRVDIDPRALPLQTELLRFLEGEHERGRELILASAADARYVRKFADHLGIFRHSMGSTPEINLKGTRKVGAIRAYADKRAFAYAGNERADLAVWRHAAEGLVVNASRRLVSAASSVTRVVHVFDDRSPTWRTLARLLRLHQWLKNLLLFVPLVGAQRLSDSAALAAVAMGFLAFSLVASATYVLNDLADIDADRLHPTKRQRPLASGAISLLAGIGVLAVAMATGFGIAAMVSADFTRILGCYVILTLGYSFYLKQLVVIDVLTLGALYTIRVVAGAVAIDAYPTSWLLAFSMFLFFGLALVKRCTELERVHGGAMAQVGGRDYQLSDRGLLYAMGIASSYLSVLVLALYFESAATLARFPRHELLWLICPTMLAWISRIWLKTARGEMNDDPIVYSLRDRASWLLLALVGLALIGAGSGRLPA
ncbi:MAG: UbiA family prenyltransferase [Burkholderiales bacterium]|nr:UbiA family prenyltransferase [Burkholderiales bacterium]